MAAVTAIAIFCYPLVTVSAAPQYTITALDVLPGTVDSIAFGLNSRGDIVGRCSLNNSSNVGQKRPTRWDRTGSPVEIWSDPSIGGIGMAINDLGQIAGRYGSGFDDPLPGPGVPYGRAFVWNGVGGLQDLGLAPVGNSQAVAINNNGQVVGTSEVLTTIVIEGEETQTFIPRAFIWDAVRGIEDLGTLGGFGAFAVDVNARGQVVGYGDTADGFERAFIWDDVIGMRAVGPMNGEQSRAMAINDQGQVLGFEFGVGAFIWDAIGGTTAIPIGGIDFNNFGQVIGGSFGDAVIWDAQNGVQHLSDLIAPNSGWQLSTVFAINDLGEIAGYGELNGQLRGFLISPIPEPRTLTLSALLIFTATGVAIARRFQMSFLFSCVSQLHRITWRKALCFLRIGLAQATRKSTTKIADIRDALRDSSSLRIEDT
jgi:probable HAF family extracellular repeat protein